MAPLAPPPAAAGGAAARKRLQISFTGAEGAAASLEAQPASPRPTRNGSSDGVAALLILGSAAAASLQAFDARYLADFDLHWSVISVAINAVSLPVLLGLFAVRGRSSVPTGLALRPSERGRWCAARSALGGLALNAAVAGVTHIDLCSANCIMFSMPCFACAIACAATRQRPARGDVVQLATGFGGTLLVVAPNLPRRLIPGFPAAAAAAAAGPVARATPRQRLLGYGGALGFAVSNAAACVVTSAKLGDARPLILCAAQALCALVIACAAAYGARADVAPSLALLRGDATLRGLLLLEVVSFPLSSFLRVAALVVSRNVHVVSLLYSEIPLVLVWDRLFRHTRLKLHQGVGVAIILAGAGLGNVLKTWTKRRKAAHDERTALLVTLPERRGLQGT